MNSILTLLIAFVMVGCTGKKEIDADIVSNPVSASGKGEGPIVRFDTTVWDFGRITEGEVVEHEFRISNAGRGHLLIAAVHTDCGCTVADYPREPIEPGVVKSIKVRFDSEGRRGRVYKQVRVVTNAVPSTHVLVIRGEVVGPPSGK